MVVVKVARGNTSFDQARDYYLQDKGNVAVLERDQDETAIERASGYVLHDKDGKRTSHRVGFTETINLDARDPAQAVREMRARYDAFKANEHSKRGRKLEKPIYAYSISWAPTEQPTKDEMLDAARSSLKAMRLEGLQTLIVQHLDELQPHIHLIVSRIEEDGRRARNIPWDHLRFSKWAEQYEREHGGIQCTNREKNNERRAKGEFVKDEKSLSREQYERTARVATAPERARRVFELPDPIHSAYALPIVRQVVHIYWLEQTDLEAKAKFKIGVRQGEVKQRLKKVWAQLFRRQDLMRRELGIANTGDPLARAVFISRHLPTLERCGKISVKEWTRLCFSGARLTKWVREAHDWSVMTCLSSSAPA